MVIDINSIQIDAQSVKVFNMHGTIIPGDYTVYRDDTCNYVRARVKCIKDSAAHRRGEVYITKLPVRRIPGEWRLFIR